MAALSAVTTQEWAALVSLYLESRTSGKPGNGDGYLAALIASVRTDTIQECAAAMGASGDYYLESAEGWLLDHFKAELSAKEPGR